MAANSLHDHSRHFLPQSCHLLKHKAASTILTSDILFLDSQVYNHNIDDPIQARPLHSDAMAPRQLRSCMINIECINEKIYDDLSDA